MTLPGDVGIRTTSRYGTLAARLYELWGAWIDPVPSDGTVGEAMAETGSEFEVAVFNVLHGFYKQAISSLRSAVEVMIGLIDSSVTRCISERTWIYCPPNLLSPQSGAATHGGRHPTSLNSTSRAAVISLI
jgi:hypothetical protein